MSTCFLACLFPNRYVRLLGETQSRNGFIFYSARTAPAFARFFECIIRRLGIEARSNQYTLASRALWVVKMNKPGMGESSKRELVREQSQYQLNSYCYQQMHP